MKKQLTLAVTQDENLDCKILEAFENVADYVAAESEEGK
jgi:hypothetical protein